jgi:arylsulfatase A-like enzyme
LFSSIEAELDLPLLALLLFWLCWHGLFAYLWWGQSSRFREVMQKTPPVPARWISGLTMVCFAGIGLSLAANREAPVHPLYYLAQSGLSGASRMTLADDAMDIDKLRYGADATTSRERAGFAALEQSLASAAAKPNIVLIVMESVGAAQLLPDGRIDPAVTPHIHRLHDRGSVLFDSVYVNFPATLHANMALNTGGLHPTWTSPAVAIADSWQGPLLAKSLRETGYRTGLFASPDLDFLGLGRFLAQAGYDRFVHFGNLAETDRQAERLDSWGGRDDRMMARAIGWMKASAGSGKPFFLHFMTNAPHHPYSVPPEFAGPKDENRSSRYRRALAFADRAIGELVDALDKAGVLKNTAIVITGDHGSGFGQGEGTGHRIRAYDETVKTFVQFSLPHLNASLRSSRVLGMGDVYPAILHLAGRETSGSPLSAGWQPRLEFFHYEARPGAWGIRDGQWKAIFRTQGASALYDLSTDPDEKIDLADRHGARMKLYDRLAATWYLRKDRQFSGLLAGYRPPARLAVSDVTAFGLKRITLGYVKDADSFGFRVAPASRFHPQEAIFTEAVWFGYPSPQQVDYVWVGPAGQRYANPIFLTDTFQTLWEPARLPRPMQEGRWTLSVEVGGEPVQKLAFEVRRSEPKYFAGDPDSLAPGSKARFQSLEVGRWTPQHQFEQKKILRSAEAFVIRSSWQPGLHDQHFIYAIESPRGQSLDIPFTLKAGTVNHDESIVPPVAMWTGTWTVRLNSAGTTLSQTRFEVHE